MIPELAADSVLCTLKRLLKQRNRSYGDVAKHLGVSLPTVKRMLNKASVPFDVLVRIAELLEISVFELMREAEVAMTRITIFDESQDALFATEPALLAYLQRLAEGKTPAEIAREHGLRPASTVKYLLRLEAAGLVTSSAHGAVRLKVKPPFGFGRKSRYLKRDLRATVEAVSARILDKLDRPERDFILVKPMRLPRHRYVEMTTELRDVVVRYARLDALGAATNERAGEDVIVIVMCDEHSRAQVVLPDL